MASLNALDFFGKGDPEGVEKFKTVAFRALLDQRTDEEFRQTKSENERLLSENATLSKQLQDLQVSFDTNVGDRERVLAFKSKRVEELNIKLKECEAINVSLLQTIKNGDAGGGTGSRAAMAALINSGKPLFHAVETCKEQEFKKLFDGKRLQCDQLRQQILDNEALVQEMRACQGQKGEVEAQIQQLREKIVAITAENDDKVHFLERKLVFEHDRLRKEKEIEIRACQDAMEKQMRTQLDITTQRTIEENERVQLELRYQSSQLEKMVKQLDHLLIENKQSQQEKRIFEDMNATLSKKIKFYEQIFAKMQQKDQLKSKHIKRMSPSLALEETRFHTPRKPPLPSIGSPRSPSTMSAFGMSPPHSPRLSRQQEDDPTSYYSDEGEFCPDGEDQLNSVSEALEVHLQHREFTKKQIDAVLRYYQQHYQHQQQKLLPRAPKTSEYHKGIFMGYAPLVKKKIVLTKAAYSPSSYQRGRRALEVPTTLDSFIRQHAAISPQQRTIPPPSIKSGDGEQTGGTGAAPTLLLPSLSPGSAPSSSHDRSDMWKAMSRPESPATARS
ncbi:hypothetical protein FI667_g10329, partial [Globisporangium splendens]